MALDYRSSESAIFYILSQVLYSVVVNIIIFYTTALGPIPSVGKKKSIISSEK